MRPAARLHLPYPRRLTGALSLLVLCVVGIGCGKKGPPLPPLKQGPGPVTQLAAGQRGRAVVLTGLIPNRSMDGSPLRPIREVRVQRLPRNLFPPGFSGSGPSGARSAIRQFNKEAARIATLAGEELGEHLFGSLIVYVDPSPVGGSIPEGGRTLTYAMTVVDIENRSSPISPFALIRIYPPLPPPSNLQVELAETRIRLRWDPPPVQKEDAGLLYNVYRAEGEGRMGIRPLNADPIPQTLFDDEDFRFAAPYRYVVRAVTGKESGGRESVDSNPLEITPLDVYAPAAPTGLAVSAGQGVINLYWFPNDDQDLGGYRIYRSEEESQGFELLGIAGREEISFVDRDVRPGVKYYYSLTAVDQASPPNESGMSAVQSDRLPPDTEQETSPTPELPGED